MRSACRCGNVAFDIDPGRGTRLVCYCKSCQAFAGRFGENGETDAWGGVDLYQTAPEAVRLISGVEHLRFVKLTPKGPLRWYAACCGTPIANTLASRNVPFITMMSQNVENLDDLGPVVARVNRKGAKGHITEPTGSSGRAVRAFILRALRSRAVRR